MSILCRLADLDATGAKEVQLDDSGIRRPAVVVACGATARAYLNSCPHARLPLNAAPDMFLDASRSFLVCVNHGAHFDTVTGICLRGPCKGERLRSISVRVENGQVICAEPELIGEK